MSSVVLQGSSKLVAMRAASVGVASSSSIFERGFSASPLGYQINGDFLLIWRDSVLLGDAEMNDAGGSCC